MSIKAWGWLILFAAAAVASHRAAAATSGRALGPAEAAIRQADADWAEAAGTASADAWMTYYAADAVVLAPNQPIATDATLIRKAVAQLLALPHLAITWHPLKVEADAAGDMAYVVGAYELSYDDPGRGRTTDRGKLLQVWRKQADGRWRCIADTWNSDGPMTAASGTAPAATPVVAETPATPPAAAANKPASPNLPASIPGEGSEYGAAPVNYESTVHQYFQEYLSDPESVRYREITAPQKAAIKALAGTVFVHQSTLKGWTVSATVDAKNSHGVYVGFKTFSFLFRGEKIVHTNSPLTGDEMK